MLLDAFGLRSKKSTLIYSHFYLLSRRSITTGGVQGVKPTDFLSTARELLNAGRNRPRQTNLRRACSTAYYALFHALCSSCASALTSKATRRAWIHVYRSVEHGIAKNSCTNKEVMRHFPDEIKDFANMFVQMHEKRHRADYDPDEKFLKSAVSNDIDAVESVIEAFKNTPLRHRRAFAAHVLLKPLPNDRKPRKGQNRP